MAGTNDVAEARMGHSPCGSIIEDWQQLWVTAVGAKEVAIERLADLLSAVTNDETARCTTSPCRVCTASERAQTFLDLIYLDRNAGWWLEESPDTAERETQGD